MKLIVGLGNPGYKYIYTKHNIGFLAISKLVTKFNLTNPKFIFNSLLWKTIINDEKVFFCQPQVFMNLSGKVVYKFKEFYKLSFKDIIVIYDDKDISFNVIKLKKNGSSAGHNGINNLIEKLNSKEFLRIRLGIGNNPFVSTNKWVLKKFSYTEIKIINNDLLERVYKILIQYFIKKYSFDKLMSIYNGNSE